MEEHGLCSNKTLFTELAAAGLSFASSWSRGGSSESLSSAGSQSFQALGLLCISRPCFWVLLALTPGLFIRSWSSPLLTMLSTVTLSSPGSHPPFHRLHFVMVPLQQKTVVCELLVSILSSVLERQLRGLCSVVLSAVLEPGACILSAPALHPVRSNDSCKSAMMGRLTP